LFVTFYGATPDLRAFFKALFYFHFFLAIIIHSAWIRLVICANFTKQDLEFRKKNFRNNVVRCFPIPVSFSFLNLQSLDFTHTFSKYLFPWFRQPHFRFSVREGKNSFAECAPLNFPSKCEQFDVLHLKYIFGLFGGLLGDIGVKWSNYLRYVMRKTLPVSIRTCRRIKLCYIPTHCRVMLAQTDGGSKILGR